MSSKRATRVGPTKLATVIIGETAETRSERCSPSSGAPIAVVEPEGPRIAGSKAADESPPHHVASKARRGDAAMIGPQERDDLTHHLGRGRFSALAIAPGLAFGSRLSFTPAASGVRAIGKKKPQHQKQIGGALHRPKLSKTTHIGDDHVSHGDRSKIQVQ
jgi:hypothetical protein